MKHSLIHIPEACHENISAMPACEKGLYCAMCKHTVRDLRKTGTAEMSEAVEQRDIHCAVIHARHDAGVKNKAMRLANATEKFLGRYKMAKLAAASVAVILFLSGCSHRHRMGKMRITKDVSPNTTEHFYEQK